MLRPAFAQTHGSAPEALYKIASDLPPVNQFEGTRKVSIMSWAGHFVGGGAASGRAAPAAPRSAQERFLRLKSRFQWIFYCGKQE
jgi:hypothetical protein